MQRFALSTLIGIASLFAAPALASDVVTRARAERLAAAGRCDEAMPLLEQIAAAEPQDARVALMLGECQIKLDRYEDAVTSLQRAKRLDPALPDVDLQLASASFHAGDYETTLSAVADARKAGSKRPELDLYEGLALYGLERDPQEAARRLESAATQGARPLDSIAGYYAGRAWQNAGDPDRATGLLQNVITNYPNSPWADAARLALEGGTTGSQERRMWGYVQGGIEWDSNAAFIGRGVELPSEIDSQSDFRGVLSGELAGEIWKHGRWTIGGRVDYYSAYNFDLTDFDLQYPGGGFWLDYALSPTSLLRLDLASHYGWLGYDPYVFANAVTPQFIHLWGPAGTSRFWISGLYYDFLDDVPGEFPGPGQTGDPCIGTGRCGPPTLDEKKERNRDGYGGAVGIDHSIPVAWLNGEIFGGIFYEVYESKGTEYRYNGYGARLGFSTQLPWQVGLSIWGGYTHRPYDNPSTYPDPDNPNLLAGQQYALSNNDRNDKIAEVEVELSRPITQNLIASIRYGYLSNDSNVAVYDYDRSLVGAYITWTFAR